MDLKKLKKEMLGLDRTERAYLAKELIASLDYFSDGEIEELWMEEVIQRDKAIAADPNLALPVNEVMARVRARRR